MIKSEPAPNCGVDIPVEPRGGPSHHLEQDYYIWPALNRHTDIVQGSLRDPIAL